MDRHDDVLQMVREVTLGHRYKDGTRVGSHRRTDALRLARDNVFELGYHRHILKEYNGGHRA